MEQIDHVLKKDVDEQRGRIIEALFVAKSRRAAAELAGVSPSTLYRLLQDEDFQRVLAEAEKAVIAQSVTRLIGEMERSVDELVRIRRDGTRADAVKLKASMALLQVGQTLRESLLVEERLSTLEDLVVELAERI